MLLLLLVAVAATTSAFQWHYSCPAAVRLTVRQAEPPSYEGVTEDDVKQLIYETEADELDETSLPTEKMEEDLPELPDEWMPPKEEAAAVADGWYGEFDGQNDPLDAPWRQEGEAIIHRAAADVGVEVMDVAWHFNKVTVTVDSPDSEDVTRASRSIITNLENVDPRLRILDRHELEVTSPGTSDFLTMQRDFDAFKGFDVDVIILNPDDTTRTITGKIVARDTMNLVLGKNKGRQIKILNCLIKEVRLLPAKSESGGKKKKKNEGTTASRPPENPHPQGETKHHR
ncbi:hypothetical protein CTAYLR_001860 [Chrysophaeum taylorii]|uniref:Uncharacterized protein n=1 Tax=Chrysophaeum taylorii TaxID=2483200 RepID=A0AAD7XIW6_9STRA|nr:hypothetical protein CTAYLR_001860 [Chrysophaeum taylorii]